MSNQFAGLYAALPTPFGQDEEVNFQDLHALLNNADAQGLDGVYVGGSTGEAFLMSLEERIATLESIAQANSNEMKLIAHVGSIRTEDCCQLAAVASHAGYDAVSAVTPFYYPFGFEALLKHYQAIIEAAEGLPMVVYNFPAMSGVNLTADQIAQLLQLDNVVAIKQTSGDLYQMEQIARNHPDKTVFNGFDEIFLSGQMAGAKGGIGSTYNVMGKRYRDISVAIDNGDIEQAKLLQQSANKVIDVLIQVGVLPGLKYLLKQMGVIQNETVRRPFVPLTTELMKVLDTLLKTELNY